MCLLTGYECDISPNLSCNLKDESRKVIIYAYLHAEDRALNFLKSRMMKTRLETIDLRESGSQIFDFRLKRLCDLVFALIILILSTPVFLVIALLIKLDSPGPVFHKQDRVGLRGNYFSMWKFRTMIINAETLKNQLETENNVTGGVIFKLKADPRITRVGKLLRHSSLDELPQLINVLVGEMSLVGPRPLVIKEVEKIPKHLLFRHDVLPGMTGLWQVNGRSSLKSEEVFYWDTIYIDRWSLGLDFKILLQTVIVVLKGDGAY